MKLARELQRPLAIYTESGGTGQTALNQDKAMAVTLEKHEVCCGLFNGFDWSKWMTGDPEQQLGLPPAAQENVLARENAKTAVSVSTNVLSSLCSGCVA